MASVVASCTILLADANAFVERGGRRAERLLAERRIDGLLMATFMPTTSAIAAMARHGLPVVLVGAGATSWLSRASPSTTGRGWVSPSTTWPASGIATSATSRARRGRHGTRRLDGFHRAMQRSGLPLSLDPRWRRRPRISVTGPARAIADCSRRPRSRRPSCCGGSATPPARSWPCASFGLSVRRTSEVVAFNDAPTAASLSPPLTAVRLPLWELAETGVDPHGPRAERSGGARRRAHPNPTEELVERASAAPPGRPARAVGRAHLTSGRPNWELGSRKAKGVGVGLRSQAQAVAGLGGRRGGSCR